MPTELRFNVNHEVRVRLTEDARRLHRENYDKLWLVVPPARWPHLTAEIGELAITLRTYNVLTNAGIKTISEVVQKSEDELLRLPNFGRRSLNDLKSALAREALALGMNSRAPYPYRAPEEDAQGWSTWQLWCLMAEFGPHLHNGGQLLFEDNVIAIPFPEET